MQHGVRVPLPSAILVEWLLQATQEALRVTQHARGCSSCIVEVEVLQLMQHGVAGCVTLHGAAGFATCIEVLQLLQHPCIDLWRSCRSRKRH